MSVRGMRTAPRMRAWKKAPPTLISPVRSRRKWAQLSTYSVVASPPARSGAMSTPEQ